ncbi:hypothetical protein SCB71_06275 [Herbiconiux sp. KACC 21604]|uniref:hypothetical protein n=1 Tax=unclassified Herbiconiux TaxID=2618217 RepID=UPI0014923943|nr:hypothetical protein [Herbiconiux sp. SALV-R1]QJU52924.1 hypothetical protein HL652_04260 [Herbiconiux sp. SALV-R1]WPO87844.1 hypothetical protein SCB71_06275 [Herbiconiux sp. KACC 21604]
MKVNYLGPSGDRESTVRKRENRRLAARTPLGDSSITRPGKRLRVGPEGIGGTLNSDGTMDWAGIVRFIGEFFQTGPSVFDGSVSITGADGTLTVTAETTLGGATQITSTLDVTAGTRLRGATTQEADFTVTAGGRIILTGTIPLVMQNGVLTFASGGELQGFAAGLRMAANNAAVTAVDGLASMQAGSTVLAVLPAGIIATGDVGTTGDVEVGGALKNPGIDTVTGVTSNVYFDNASKSFKLII